MFDLVRKRKHYSHRALAIAAIFLLLFVMSSSIVSFANGSVRINEIRIDQPSTDNDEYFELAGDAGTSLSGLTYLVIGDGTGGSGVIEAVIDLGSESIPPSGFFVAAEATFSLGSADLTTSLNFENSDNVTHLLVQGFTGSNGDDLDSDDDGTLDTSPWTSILDSVALIETVGSGDQVYSTTHVGPDGSFVPGHVYFCPIGWQIGAFDPSGGDDSPGAANTCPLPGLVINEIMQNPGAVSDSNGEWFEILNPESSPIDINGWTIQDNDTDSHVINNSGPLLIPAGGYLVVGNNINSGTNGGVSIDYQYTGVFLGNGSDELVLLDTSLNEIDRVEWDDGATFPDPNGASMALQDPGLDNNIGSNWCTSSTPYGDGDLGTPGSLNDCPVPGAGLVINEIDYDQPSTDTAEFIEIKNASVSPINLDAFTLELINGTGGGASGYNTIDLPDVDLPSGGYFVVCGDAANVQNCDLDVSPNSNLIQNGAPDAVALVSGGLIIDTVSYEGNTGAPYTEGSGVGLSDSGSIPFIGISRFPDGFDSGVNNVDLSRRCITPGFENSSQSTGCVLPTELTIMEIQGAGHRSPYAGDAVLTHGVVTVVRSLSFYMQDPVGDGDIATSDGILVFLDSSPGVAVGDAVSVTGIVTEFYPGGIGTGNLSTTEITSPSVVINSSGNAPSAPTIIGTGGRVPPSMVIDDDATGDVETTGSFDSADDGIDFYESLEGMLVQVNDALVVGPTSRFGEITVVGDNGAFAGEFTFRGGLSARLTDFNPERIIIDDAIVSSEPDVNVGDLFSAPIVGVMDYSFGNFKVLNFDPLPSVISAGLIQESASASHPSELSVASLNVENLDPGDPGSKFIGLANLVVNNLRSPDILALQEIQDNNGTTNDGTVDASVTYGVLISAIQSAGGPLYEYRDIPPLDNQDGGQPGSNIRVGFLFNPLRVTFVDRPGGDATTATAVVLGGSGVELTLSPGRIDPTDPSFFDARKSLAGEFLFDGETVIVIANHFKSKSEDDPLFGRIQPPVQNTLAQRLGQAQAVNDFVDSVLGFDPDANVIVIGDLNDFQFSQPLSTLSAGILTNLIDGLALGDQYSFIFNGNSQVLDHLLVTDRLFGDVTYFDAVHANAEFASDLRATDHDPLVGRFCLDVTAPSLEVSVSPDSLWPPNHKYVEVAVSVTQFSDNLDPAPTLDLVSVVSNEPDDGLGDGDTANDIVVLDDFTFQLRAERSGTGEGRIYTITYLATDYCGNETVVAATVTVPKSER